MRKLPMAVAILVATLTVTSVAQVPDVTPVHSVEPGTAECRADDVACRDWLQFRRFVVGPYQSFAIAAHEGRATVIISEPAAPPAELLALVRATFKTDLIAHGYRRWSTGLDGWLEDLVLDVRLRDARTTRVTSGHDLAPWQAPASIVDRLRFLHAGLYGTVDAFWVDDITAFRNRTSPPSIPEPAVLAGDLLDWLVDPARTWTDVAGSADSVPFKAIVSTRGPKVYRRSDNALVSLVIPAQTSLASLGEPFRRFAVASDLLLGAYQTKAEVTWIIGRARQLPFTTLPPLRVETLASFVRDRTTELMQSYERRRIFAGRVRTGPFAGWDWAPILLSRQLDDSEFGTLLNHADQILKSWSEAGSIDYYAFRHPKPPRFPFDPQPATEFFARRLLTTTLVFNWNTQAFSTIHEIDHGELLSVDRFGALPILYLPSGSILDSLAGTGADALRRLVTDRQSDTESVARDAAATARAYFAQLGDPILVRVAQNVLLYQVAQAFLGSVVAPAPTAGPSRFDGVSRILREEAAAWLRAVAAPGRTPGMDPDAEATLERAIRSSSLTIDQLAEAIATPQVTWARLAGLVAKIQQGQKRLHELEPQYETAFAVYSAAFKAFCTSVGGKLRPAVPGLDGKDMSEICDYTSGLSSFSPARQRLDEAEAAVKSLEGALTSIAATQKAGLAELDRLSKTSKEAEGLADLLSDEAATTAQLDRIMARLRAAVASEPRGSIRTPALVLSRNTDDDEAIGGHNISFDPVRVRVTSPPIAPGRRSPPPAGRGRGGVASPETLPRIPRANDALATSATEALGVTRPGSLLDEMRNAARTPVDATLVAQVARDASACACAVIRQTANGEFLFARGGRPPVQRRLSSAADIVDALAGPPPATTVRFDGMSDAPGLLESIVRSTELSMDAAVPATTRLKRLSDVAARIFRAETDSSGQATLFSYFRRGREPQTLRVSGLTPDAAGRFISQPVSRRTALVEEGTVTTLESGSTTTTYVTFGNRSAAGGGAGGRGRGVGSGGSTGSGGSGGRGGGRASAGGPSDGPTTPPVGIEVQTDRGRSAIAPASLAKTVRSGLVTADAGVVPMGDALLLLRETIERQLDPTEINFFVEGGSTPMRISRRPADSPAAHGE